MRQERLRKFLGTLSSRERAMLELRYGLDGQHRWFPGLLGG